MDQRESEPFGSSMEALNLRREASSTSSVKEKLVKKEEKSVRANESENWWLNLVAIKENEEDLLRETDWSESE